MYYFLTLNIFPLTVQYGKVSLPACLGVEGTKLLQPGQGLHVFVFLLFCVCGYAGSLSPPHGIPKRCFDGPRSLSLFNTLRLRR